MSVVPTVLVVEDNPTTRKLLHFALTTAGYGVVEAADGRSALAAAQRGLPDLILQDLILPDMDGFELLRRLRGLEGGAKLPILALSGFLSRLQEPPTDECRFTALLVKPIEPSRLLEVIRLHLPDQQPRAVSSGAGRRLLVVDDDSVQLKLARIRFAHLGFDVIAVASASEALIAARAHRPDVILSDVFMPETDGFQLCLDVRRDTALSDVPVVLVSGQDGSVADQELARRVGANALVLRTPDFGNAVPAIEAALITRAPAPTEERRDELELRHARVVIHQLEKQNAAMVGLAQRCGVQAAELSLLSGVAAALTRHTDIDAVLRDVLGATLDAAGISKGALLLRDGNGVLELRQDIGFSELERTRLQDFFGHGALLEDIVGRGGSVAVPSGAIPQDASRDILAGANVKSAHVVPLISNGTGMGVMIIGATYTDVNSDDSVAFARAMGNQLVQSVELARSVVRLTASEQRYRTLLENANDFIAMLTPAGVVREMNQRWVAFTGLPHEQLIGRHVREFAAAGHEDQLVRMYEVGRATSSIRDEPVEIVASNGSRVLMELSCTHVDVSGERLVFTIGRDVTGQRLLEDQLRQSQKLEAIGQLAGGVAHDFNNVLTAILGFTELLLEGFSSHDPRHDDLLEIKKAGQRAAGLTRQLLAFSRKQILQPRVLNLNAVIAGVEPMLKRLIFEHIDLQVSLAPTIGLVKMDPTQLERILINLVVNAADAMPRGGRLTIETGRVTIGHPDQQRHLPLTPGEYVMLAVKDTGVGMDAQTIQRIFEPFFTTKGAGKGTGLGLSTAHGIVKQSGGDIRVNSEAGCGSTFEIYLPQVVPPVSGAIERTPETGELARGSETILLVEDDDGVRLLGRVTLERAGYRVLPAANPKDALRIAAEFAGPIDLLLSDIIMPESEGPPLFDRLAQIKEGLRVLYMSGYADEAIIRHGVLTEGTPFLQKPFTPLALALKVRDVLQVEQARSAVR